MQSKRWVEIWQCDICRKWFPTSQIRKVPHDTLQMPGKNYLVYSDYNAGTWSLTGPTYEGQISMGTSGDFRLKVQESTSGTPQLFATTLLYAAHTFQGPGQIITYTAGGLGAVAATSGYCFWVQAGSKEDEAKPFTVELGVCDSVLPFAANHKAFATFDVLGQRQIWFFAPLSQLPTYPNYTFLYMTVSCDADCKYWLQNASLTPDIAFPDVFLPTNGSPSIVLAPQWTRMAVYACQKDADEVLLRRKTPGRRENRMIPPYEERET